MCLYGRAHVQTSMPSGHPKAKINVIGSTERERIIARRARRYKLARYGFTASYAIIESFNILQKTKGI